MSPMPQARGGKISPANNLYTAILAVALGVVIASAAFVAFKCYTQYGTFFGTP